MSCGYAADAFDCHRRMRPNNGLLPAGGAETTQRCRSNMKVFGSNP